MQYECKYKLDGKKYNSNEIQNSSKCSCECKKHHIYEKDYIWDPASYSCKNDKYLASIIYNSVTTFDQIIDAEKKKLFQQILILKKQPVK